MKKQKEKEKKWEVLFILHILTRLQKNLNFEDLHINTNFSHRYTQQSFAMSFPQ